MSGGGSKTQKTTTQSSSAPWKPSQENLKYGLDEAKNLYESGTGFQPYTGSTVVPYSQQTMGAMDTMGQKADWAQGAVAKPFEAFSNQIDYLSPIARGDFSNDPTFNQTLGAAQRDARLNVDMGASDAGRYGSAVHQGNVAREIGELTNRAQLNRQKWAQGSLGDAASGLTQGYGTAMLPEDTQMQIGSMYEDLMGRQMNDELRLFNERQSMPYNALNQFMATSSGAGQLGGTSSGASIQPNPNYRSPVSTAFGNALTGYAATQSPVGAGLGFATGLFS